MGPKIYIARDASSLIPDLEKIFEQVDRLRARLKHIKGKVDVLELLWGDEVRAETTPDHREYTHYLDEIEQSKKDFDAVNRKFAEMETLVKSLDQGLVDFYGVIEGRLVFLCWKRGERAVEYYHHLEEGFQGRQPIPAEELAR